LRFQGYEVSRFQKISSVYGFFESRFQDFEDLLCLKEFFLWFQGFEAFWNQIFEVSRNKNFRFSRYPGFFNLETSKPLNFDS
jgi:hypothetical protein